MDLSILIPIIVESIVSEYINSHSDIIKKIQNEFDIKLEILTNDTELIKKRELLKLFKSKVISANKNQLEKIKEITNKYSIISFNNIKTIPIEALKECINVLDKEE